MVRAGCLAEFLGPISAAPRWGMGHGFEALSAGRTVCGARRHLRTTLGVKGGSGQKSWGISRCISPIFSTGLRLSYALAHPHSVCRWHGNETQRSTRPGMGLERVKTLFGACHGYGATAKSSEPSFGAAGAQSCRPTPAQTHVNFTPNL